MAEENQINRFAKLVGLVFKHPGLCHKNYVLISGLGGPDVSRLLRKGVEVGFLAKIDKKRYVSLVRFGEV